GRRGCGRGGGAIGRSRPALLPGTQGGTGEVAGRRRDVLLPGPWARGAGRAPDGGGGGDGRTSTRPRGDTCWTGGVPGGGLLRPDSEHRGQDRRVRLARRGAGES